MLTKFSTKFSTFQVWKRSVKRFAPKFFRSDSTSDPSARDASSPTSTRLQRSSSEAKIHSVQKQQQGGRSVDEAAASPQGITETAAAARSTLSKQPAIGLALPIILLLYHKNSSMSSNLLIKNR